MRVLKFGGTSVGSIPNIHKVITIVSGELGKSRLAVVVSALGGVTDLLEKAGELAAQKDTSYREISAEIINKHLTFTRELTTDITVQNRIEALCNDLEDQLQGIYLVSELSPKSKDKLTSFGELASSILISEAFRATGIEVHWVDSRDLIITDDQHGRAQVDFPLTRENIQSQLGSDETQLFLLPGFISRSHSGDTTTLGRGGSDYTAAIIAAGIEAERLEIWTDVNGMYTANPKHVKEARPIRSISYHEAMELSHFGAKVIYPPTIAPVMQKNIPIHVKSTLQPEDPGTVISNVDGRNGSPVKGLSHIPDIALLTLEGAGMIGVPGFSRRLFEVLSFQQINVIFITQASSEHSICIGILEQDAERARKAIDAEFNNEIQLKKLKPLIVEKNLAMIALVGDRMKSHQGISGRMFSVLGRNNVNVRAIAQGASEKNISAVIDEKDVVKALNSLHERFFEAQRKQINVFITGVGNVGGQLLGQIKQQREYLKDNLNLDIRVLGISNSRKMCISEDGISLDNWESELDSGVKADLDAFREQIVALNKRNSVFVDITASEQVAFAYDSFLKYSIPVVACNKIAGASEYSYYDTLKSLSRKYNAPFLYETNVGAGLPVIETLQNLIASGDRILKIEAVLSGSLNFVFNNFQSGRSFHDIVQQAKTEGYTEPDPRIDLSGIDVARKILILARESGWPLDLESVNIVPFLTEKNLNSSSVDHFFETLTEDAGHFEDLVKNATENGCKLKYVATLKDGKATTGLQEIPLGHPFYDLEGKDNIVLYYTERYKEQPLIVKGAGAGADVTASGLFADIIKLRKF